ncbi:MAG: hypothetical protein WD042_02170 [Phycisphaeraceae bacterium]
MPEIDPGSSIRVKVTKRPTNAAARKTIVRLLSKDSSVAKENQRHRKIRAKGIRWDPRGGRLWATRVVKQPAVAAEPGVEKTITATLDVLRDLASVERFVEVQKA